MPIDECSQVWTNVCFSFRFAIIVRSIGLPPITIVRSTKCRGSVQWQPDCDHVSVIKCQCKLPLVNLTALLNNVGVWHALEPVSWTCLFYCRKYFDRWWVHTLHCEYVNALFRAGHSCIHLQYSHCCSPVHAGFRCDVNNEEYTVYRITFACGVCYVADVGLHFDKMMIIYNFCISA